MAKTSPGPEYPTHLIPPFRDDVFSFGTVYAAAMRLFTAGIVTVVVVLLGLFGLASQMASRTPKAVDESERPLTGSPNDLFFTDDQLAIARNQLQGSFIGVVPCTLTTAYHASLARAVITRANALGLQTRVIDSENDRSLQPAIVDRFVVEGAKAIFVCPLDFSSLMPSLQAAQEAGVKVMTTGDVPLGKGTVVLSITNERMGSAIGEYAAKYINENLGGKAQVMVLDYPPVPFTVDRAQAMEKALLAAAPGATIVGRWIGGLSANGEKSMQEALQDFPDINVILSINDAGAFGAVKALQAAGKQPVDVAIFSVDAEPEAKRMIRDNEYFVASFDNDPVYAGTLAIDAAVKMLGGGITPQQVLLPGQVYTKEVAAQETPIATP
ncbi:MAG: sugar ABC transporter substrate-binding protein [Anaerolineae bacterium]